MDGVTAIARKHHLESELDIGLDAVQLVHCARHVICTTTMRRLEKHLDSYMMIHLAHPGVEKTFTAQVGSAFRRPDYSGGGGDRWEDIFWWN